MERILLIINSKQVSVGAISFACYVAMHTKSELTGLIVVDNDFRLIPTNEQNAENYFNKTGAAEAQMVKMDADQALAYFKDVCHRHGVKATVITDRGNPLEEIVFESRFADLLIIDPLTTFSKKHETLPTHFVKEVVAKSECPVMVAPEIFDDIEEIIFCYDGSRSAAYAIKQFSYLFPAYKSKNIKLLEVKSETEGMPNTSVRKMFEWLKCHYAHVEHQMLEGDPGDEMFTYMVNKKNLVVVMGAYGRGMFSTFFKRSSADLIMKVIDQPLFIAHA